MINIKTKDIGKIKIIIAFCGLVFWSIFVIFFFEKDGPSESISTIKEKPSTNRPSKKGIDESNSSKEVLNRTCVEMVPYYATLCSDFKKALLSCETTQSEEACRSVVQVFIKLNKTNFDLLGDKNHSQYCPNLVEIDHIEEICEQAPEFRGLSERFFKWVIENNIPSFQYLKSAPLMYGISNKSYQKNYDQIVKKQNNKVEFPDLLPLQETSLSETDTVLFLLKGLKLKCLPSSVVNYVNSDSAQKNNWGGIDIIQYKKSIFESCALMKLRLLTNMSVRKIDNILSRVKSLTYSRIANNECGYAQPRVYVAINMHNEGSMGVLIPPSIQVLDNDEIIQNINQFQPLFFDNIIVNPVLKYQNKHFILVVYIDGIGWGFRLYEVTKNNVLLKTQHGYDSEYCGS